MKYSHLDVHHLDMTTVPKLRRNKVKLKFRPPVPVPVKDGDASIRIATDLPRFNWLELKLSQKQEPEVDLPINNPKDVIVPLKMRILRKTSDLDTSHRVLTATAKNNPQEPSATLTSKQYTELEMNKTNLEMCSDHSQLRIQNHPSEERVTINRRDNKMENISTETVVSCKWPLKKRAVRPENITPEENSTTSPPDVIPLTTDDIHVKDITHSLATERGPVIMKLVLPPTPPLSSIETTQVLTNDNQDIQDKPLDLSKPLMLTKENSQPDMKNIPVIVLANGLSDRHSANPLVGHSTGIGERTSVDDHRLVHSVGNGAGNRTLEALEASIDSFPPMKRYRMDSDGLERSKVNDISFLPQTVVENRLPLRNGSRIETNRPVVNFHRSIFEHGRTIKNIQNGKSIGDYDRIKDVPSPAQVAEQYRLPNLVVKQQPILVPALRPHTSMMEPRFPVNGLANIHDSRPVDHHGEYGRHGVSFQRYFRPNSSSLPKMNPSRSSSSNQRVTSWVDWSPSCHVCSRRAGFRCAGCHRNAYCSVLCQAMDWPRHSQLCQLKS